MKRAACFLLAGVAALSACDVPQNRASAAVRGSGSSAISQSGTVRDSGASPGQGQPDRGAWQVDASTDQMDDVTNVTLMLQADAPLGIAFPYHDEYAGLVIRCRKGKTDLYVATRTPVKTDYDDDYESLGSKVRYRFDEGRPRTDYWSEATDHEGLFASDPIELARRLGKTRDWKFEFTPFDAASVTVDFTTAGLATVLPQVARACHWRV